MSLEYGKRVRECRGYTAQQKRDGKIRLAFRQKKAHLIKCYSNKRMYQ